MNALRAETVVLIFVRIPTVAMNVTADLDISYQVTDTIAVVTHKITIVTAALSTY